MKLNYRENNEGVAVLMDDSCSFDGNFANCTRILKIYMPQKIHENGVSFILQKLDHGIGISLIPHLPKTLKEFKQLITHSHSSSLTDF